MNNQVGNSFPTNGNVSRSTASAFAQVTKGVTAFLLKQSDSVTPGQNLDTYLRDPTKFSLYSNHYDSNVVQNTFQPKLSDVHEADVGVISTSNNSVYNHGPITAPASSNSYYQSESTRELIGYLQHVYHNDFKWSDNDVYTVRQIQRNAISNLAPVGTNQTVNFDTVFNRENNTLFMNKDSIVTGKQYIHHYQTT